MVAPLVSVIVMGILLFVQQTWAIILYFDCKIILVRKGKIAIHRVLYGEQTRICCSVFWEEEVNPIFLKLLSILTQSDVLVN